MRREAGSFVSPGLFRHEGALRDVFIRNLFDRGGYGMGSGMVRHVPDAF
jgi:hypothetical protein